MGAENYVLVSFSVARVGTMAKAAWRRGYFTYTLQFTPEGN